MTDTFRAQRPPRFGRDSSRLERLLTSETGPDRMAIRLRAGDARYLRSKPPARMESRAGIGKIVVDIATCDVAADAVGAMPPTRKARQ